MNNCHRKPACKFVWPHADIIEVFSLSLAAWQNISSVVCFITFYLFSLVSLSGIYSLHKPEQQQINMHLSAWLLGRNQILIPWWANMAPGTKAVRVWNMHVTLKGGKVSCAEMRRAKWLSVVPTWRPSEPLGGLQLLGLSLLPGKTPHIWRDCLSSPRSHNWPFVWLQFF